MECGPGLLIGCLFHTPLSPQRYRVVHLSWAVHTPLCTSSEDFSFFSCEIPFKVDGVLHLKWMVFRGGGGSYCTSPQEEGT